MRPRPFRLALAERRANAAVAQPRWPTFPPYKTQPSQLVMLKARRSQLGMARARRGLHDGGGALLPLQPGTLCWQQLSVCRPMRFFLHKSVISSLTILTACREGFAL